MRNSDIKKLQYPLWFNIVFIILTVVVPVVLFVYEGITAANGYKGTIFKVSFISITILLFTWILINKFVLTRYKEKLIASKAVLEHDYSTEIGNPDKIKVLWFSNERMLAIFDTVSILLYGGLIVLAILGIQSGLMSLRGSLVLIVSSYLIAYTIKFVILISKKEIVDERDTGTESSESNQNSGSETDNTH